MELKLLKEETDREKEKSLSAAEAARNNLTEIASQRDAAKQEARDLERQLAATLADLELSRKDYERAVLSNENLQSALESFQVEREAELSLLEEQRKHAEATLAAAHAAGIEAINEVNEARVKEVQLAADSAIRNLMEEIKVLEASVEVSTRLVKICFNTCIYSWLVLQILRFSFNCRNTVKKLLTCGVLWMKRYIDYRLRRKMSLTGP